MRKEESSFCEQKEAKKLYAFDLNQRHALGPNAMGEVFLLLFVHKKKILSGLPA
jgi:hypothetical protein